MEYTKELLRVKNGIAILSASSLCTLALTLFPVASMAASGQNSDYMSHFATQPSVQKRNHSVRLPVKPSVQNPGYMSRFVIRSLDFKYMPRFSVGPFYQTGNSSFGLYDIFVPFTMNSKSILFVDGRYIDRGNTWESNIGVGFRKITKSRNLLWTLYSFYDNRRTRFSNYFGQVTVGADFQTEKWYFNTNGYIPVGKKQQFVDAFNTASLCNGNTRICYARGIEKSMGGWDAEVGRDFFRGLKGYAGMYVFAREGVETAIGPNLRLQYDIEHQDQKRVFHLFNKIALIANWRDDQLVGSSWYAGVRFDIGIGPEPRLVDLERKMTSFVRRDLNIEMSSDGSGSNAALTQPIKILTNDFDGQETQVALTTPGILDGPLTAIVNNPRNNIVGVVGAAATLASDKDMRTNQILEGGVFSFTREGANFSVQVGQNGAFPLGASGFTIDVGTGPTVGQNVTIENMAFSDTNGAPVTPLVGTAATFLNPIGTLTIRNNTDTGLRTFVSIGRSAVTTEVIIISGNTISGQVNPARPPVQIIGHSNATGGSETVIIDGNTITPAGPVTAIILVGAGGFGVTHPTLLVSVTNNTLTTTGVGIANASLDLRGLTGILTVSDLRGNTITNTGVGSTALGVQNNVTFQGNINNNAFSSNPAAAEGVLDFRAAVANSSLHVVGAITGNTITNVGGLAGERAVSLQALLGASSVVVGGGFVGNTINAGAGRGVETVTGAGVGSVVLGAFNNNTFTLGFEGGRAISTNFGTSGTTSFSIGGGATAGTVAALEAANGLALGTSITVVPTTIIAP